MTIFALLVLIAMIGFVAWALPKIFPMSAQMQSTLQWVAVAIVLLLVLQQFGVLNMVDRPVPRFP